MTTVTIDSRLFQSELDLATILDATALQDFLTDYPYLADWFAILGGTSPVADLLSQNPTSIQPTQLLWGDTTDGIEITGTGLNQIIDLEALQLALENGTATGGISGIRVFSNGAEIATVALTPTQYTVTSADLSLVLTGALPTSLQQFYDVTTSALVIAGYETADASALDAAIDALRVYDIAGLAVTDDGSTLLSLELGTDAIVLTALGAEFRIDGSFPTENLGAFLDVLRSFVEAEAAGTPITDLSVLGGLAITGATLTAANDDVLLTMDAITSLEAPILDSVVIQGSPGNDRDLVLPALDSSLLEDLGLDLSFLSGFDFDQIGEVLVNLGSGDDSLLVSGMDDPLTDILFAAPPVRIDAGAGSDLVQVGSNTAGFLEIAHDDLNGAGIGHQISIDNSGADGTVNKGANGLTTIQNVVGAMNADGLGVNGSASADTFTLFATADGMIAARGGRGNDTFTLGPSGTIHLAFDSDNGLDAATQGVVLNVGTGTVSNDGFGGTDTIIGVGPVDLVIRGSAQADSLTGWAGRDRFDQSDGGNDTVDGGAGEADEVLFCNADMAVTVDLGAGTATATGAGGFMQTLMNIEQVDGSDFDDRILGNLGSNVLKGCDGDDAIHGDWFDIGAMYTVAAQVYRLYDALLGRTADYGGHGVWTQRIVEGERTLEEVSSGFVNSPEFLNVYGGVTNTEYVTLLFQNVLGRDPGPGAQGFINGLDAGTLTREGVALEFSETQEFVNATAANVLAFIEAASESVWVDDVYRLYQATLDRLPDLSGLVGWITNLGAGREFQSVVSGFVNSTEFQNLYGATTDEQFVTLLYNNVLGRVPTAQEVQGWLDLMTGGRTREEVVTGFSQSPEFRNATADDLESFVRGLGVEDELSGEAGANVLIGGALADQFIFDQSDDGTHTVVDMEVWDTLVFDGFGYMSEDDVRARMSQVESDVVFADQGVTVTIANTQLASISDDMIGF